MDDAELYDIVDYILNRAGDAELEVIIKAVQRRTKDQGKGPMGLNPERLAKTVAHNINEQMGSSIDQVRGMVRDFITDIIRKEAPDISEEHLETLLNEWAPGVMEGRGNSLEMESEGVSGLSKGEESTSGQKSTSSDQERSYSEEEKEILLAMIKQFITYSTGAMSVTEEEKLRREIPDWQQKYWRKFPERVRRLINLFLKGKIGLESCWESIEEELSS
jgi:hypothetical protein